MYARRKKKAQVNARRRTRIMRKTKLWSLVTMVIWTVVLLFTFHGRLSARPQTRADINIKSDDLGGVVTSTKGPEAGVWVIAETTDLPTKFVKIVVTDDSGRYLVPQLPKANYKVWVRGYGLVDSQPVQTEPGKMVNLTAVVAPDAHAAAQYYPSEYWFSMLKIPPKSDFPGTGAGGNGIPENVKSQAQWIDMVKVNNCTECHEMGDKATREIPASLGHFDSSGTAWSRRLASAQIGPTMTSQIARFGTGRAYKMFGDWTDRVAAGELPAEVPPRPQGMERNIVISEWDWSTPKEYFHDEISTDRRHPTVNANGLVYGVHEVSSDNLTVVDPVHNTTTQIRVPVRDANTPFASVQSESFPSPYFGDQLTWDSKANVHSLEMDSKGRVWLAATIRDRDNPAFCKAGSDNPSAKLFPLDRGGRQVTMYDPETKKFSNIDLCFSTQHLMFSEDANDTLWFSNPGGDVVGWLNVKMWDQTHDASKSQGWTALIVDTNGNGKRDDYVEPGQPLDPKKDMRIKGGFYAVNWSPVDGSIWGTVLAFPGELVRLNLGSNPPATALAEVYQMPFQNPKAAVQGFGTRGGDIDRNGVYWTIMTSGHFASFDRRKCKGPLNGPQATGQQCPEGWTLYPLPGPRFRGVDEVVSADSNYYAWVDQFDTFGLGKNVPIATGNGSDALIALLPESKKMVTLRVPYPMGFYAKSVDGRIDDPRAGWKGKGLWSTYGTRTPQHIEPPSKDTTAKVVKFQYRPDPLAD
jgi:hypothetical protein